LKKLIGEILFWLNLLLALLLAMSYLANYINPTYIWSIAFLGLLYPFLFLLNTTFAIFWIFMRKWYALVSVVIILLGWGYIGRFIQLRFDRKDIVINSDINLLSYNVRMFNKYEWEKRIGVGDSILQHVSERGANIACFQEYLTVDAPNRFNKSSLDSFIKDFPFRHEYFTSNEVPTWSTGIATFSKLQIIRKGQLNFENSYNSCNYSDIIYESDTIRIFNVHLQSIYLKEDSYSIINNPVNKIDQKRLNEMKDITGRLKAAYIKRAIQVDEVSRLIRRSPYPVIVCGDFNDTPLSYTYHKIRGNLRDAFIEAGRGFSNTYRGNFPSFRIDFIFYSRSFIAVGYQCDRVTYSDHFPVNCQLNIK
jgi:endonuclease/exonuclease/phosphatase family metal-dependent hydrolase